MDSDLSSAQHNSFIPESSKQSTIINYVTDSISLSNPIVHGNDSNVRSSPDYHEQSVMSTDVTVPMFCPRHDSRKQSSTNEEDNANSKKMNHMDMGKSCNIEPSTNKSQHIHTETPQTSNSEGGIASDMDMRSSDVTNNNNIINTELNKIQISIPMNLKFIKSQTLPGISSYHKELEPDANKNADLNINTREQMRRPDVTINSNIIKDKLNKTQSTNPMNQRYSKDQISNNHKEHKIDANNKTEMDIDSREQMMNEVLMHKRTDCRRIFDPG